MPRAENTRQKTKETEETYGSGSEEDHSDSDEEGTDGYKKGQTPETHVAHMLMYSCPFMYSHVS